MYLALPQNIKLLFAVVLGVSVGNATAATVHECRAYNGSTFYSDGLCSQNNAVGVINHSVPDGMSFDQQVQVVESKKAEVRANEQARQQAQRVNKNDVQMREWQCQQLDRQIEGTDAALRQPHSGEWGDYLNEQRRKFMDERFALRC